ncbi:MAG TPA: hypothetical protein VLA19_06405 [Herpetosiphonaceae bacterium]|nr:hypothetical protein [Herpetosiphonaceae bacterium]
MQMWLADHPSLAAGDGDAARRQWLQEFPALARSNLGRALDEVMRRVPGWSSMGAARLADFYESDLFRRIEPQFREQLALLRSRWRAG